MDNFKELISSDEKTIVKFGASWCGPCRIADKAIKQVLELGHKRVYSIDVEDFKELGFEYQIKSLPTWIVFKNGLPVEKFVGIKKAEELIQKLK